MAIISDNKLHNVLILGCFTLLFILADDSTILEDNWPAQFAPPHSAAHFI